MTVALNSDHSLFVSGRNHFWISFWGGTIDKLFCLWWFCSWLNLCLTEEWDHAFHWCLLVLVSLQPTGHKLLFSPSPQKPILYSGETSDRDEEDMGSSSANGQLQCCQTHQLMLLWLKRQNVEWKWKTNGKRAYFFKGVRHRSSGFPSCPGSHWAVDVRTVLGHFLHNILPLERIDVQQRSIRNRQNGIEKIKKNCSNK